MKPQKFKIIYYHRLSTFERQNQERRESPLSRGERSFLLLYFFTHAASFMNIYPKEKNVYIHIYFTY